SAELSLATASTLYRYGLMAKILKISVRDLIALKSLAGLDPFMPLTRDPIASIADDYPVSQTIRFVEIASAVRDSGFKVEDVSYLLRHRFAPVGKYRAEPDSVMTLVRSLSGGMQSIKAEHALIDDEALKESVRALSPPGVAV